MKKLYRWQIKGLTPASRHPHTGKLLQNSRWGKHACSKGALPPARKSD